MSPTRRPILQSPSQFPIPNSPGRRRPGVALGTLAETSINTTFTGNTGPVTITNAQLVALLGTETDFKLRANADQAAATDLASVITLANELRAALVEKGLIEGEGRAPTKSHLPEFRETRHPRQPPSPDLAR